MSDIRRIISIVTGGQSGVDRACMDAAKYTGIPYSGYCPKGRLAEDGVIDKSYNLTELDSSSYSDRTRKNILVSARKESGPSP